jgi:hypothetical protein
VGASGGCVAVEGVVAIGFGAGGRFSSLASGLGWRAGVSSTVLCFPVVQGGMERNSSKVRNLCCQ